MEEKIKEILKKNINSIVPFYLMLSYGYYCLDESIVSDKFYDGLAKIFLGHYDKLKHRHKELI